MNPEYIELQDTGIEDRLIKALYVLELGEVACIDIGRWKSDVESERNVQKQIAMNIDEVCAAFEINSTNAIDRVVKPDVVNPYDSIHLPVSGLLCALLEEASIGRYVCEAAYWALPIESAEYASTMVEISFLGDGDEQIMLQGEGSFDTVRADNDSYIEYEIHFKAMIAPDSKPV